MPAFWGRRPKLPEETVDRLAISLSATAATVSEMLLRDHNLPSDTPTYDLEWKIRAEVLAFLLHTVDRYAFADCGPDFRQWLLDELTPVTVELSLQMAFGDLDSAVEDRVYNWTLDRVADRDAEFGEFKYLTGDGRSEANFYTMNHVLGQCYRNICEHLSCDPDFFAYQKFGAGLVTLLAEQQIRGRVQRIAKVSGE